MSTALILFLADIPVVLAVGYWHLKGYFNGDYSA